jgi:ribosomal protein L15
MPWGDGTGPFGDPYWPCRRRFWIGRGFWGRRFYRGRFYGSPAYWPYLPGLGYETTTLTKEEQIKILEEELKEIEAELKEIEAEKREIEEALKKLKERK